MSGEVASLVAYKPRRPILTHLNEDTSWLLSFPRRQTEKASTADTSRSYYHVVLDLWLDGQYIVKHHWIMAIEHSIKASFSTVQQVREYIQQIERAAGSLSPTDEGEPDAAFVSHYLGDHCSQESLLQLHAETPVVTVNGAATMIEKWNHFTNVEVMPDLSLQSPEDLWQRPSASTAVPEYIRIGRLPSGEAYPELHWATLIAYTGSECSEDTETILYSPHGIYAERLAKLDWATSHSRPLAILHGLDPAWSPQAANLGVDNGEKLAKTIKPKYWIATHDEHLTYSGIIGWFQTKHKKTFPAEIGFSDENSSAQMLCKEIGNGQSFVLA